MTEHAQSGHLEGVDSGLESLELGGQDPVARKASGAATVNCWPAGGGVDEEPLLLVKVQLEGYVADPAMLLVSPEEVVAGLTAGQALAEPPPAEPGSTKLAIEGAPQPLVKGLRSGPLLPPLLRPPPHLRHHRPWWQAVSTTLTYQIVVHVRDRRGAVATAGVCI